MHLSSRLGESVTWYAPAMSTTPSSPKKKPSSVRHTRAIQRDRQTRPNTAPPDAQIEARLFELVHPATYAQVAAYQAMGLRERILTLPVMVAFVLPSDLAPAWLGHRSGAGLGTRRLPGDESAAGFPAEPLPRFA